MVCLELSSLKSPLCISVASSSFSSLAPQSSKTTLATPIVRVVSPGAMPVVLMSYSIIPDLTGYRLNTFLA